MKTWFITGISRGLGLELARAALARGDRVIGTVREGCPALPDQADLHIVTLDLAQGDSIRPAIEAAFKQAGSIDVVVNNAGYGLLGALETATEAEMARLFAVDVFGPVRVIQAALPFLRAQGSGHIINITSIAGRAPGPNSALYAAVKFALEGLSTSLVQELAPFGIKVTAVAPGAFRTDFLSTHSIRKSSVREGYAATVGQTLAAFDDMAGRQIGDPARAAKALLGLADAGDPPAHLLLGSDALRRMREKLDAVIEDMDRWEAVTVSTDFPKEA